MNETFDFKWFNPIISDIFDTFKTSRTLQERRNHRNGREKWGEKKACVSINKEQAASVRAHLVLFHRSFSSLFFLLWTQNSSLPTTVFHLFHCSYEGYVIGLPLVRKKVEEKSLPIERTMGGGASSFSAIPEILTEEQFKLIAGNLYSKDVFDQLKNSDGKITRANLLQELKVEYNPSVDLKIIQWEQLMFDSSEEIGRGSFPASNTSDIA